MTDLSLNLSTQVKRYDVIVFSETWLTDDIADSELPLKDYNVYRCDRDILGVSRGGGVLVAVDKKLKSSLCLIDSRPTSFEHISVRISSGGANLIVGAVYIPLASCPDPRSFEYSGQISHKNQSQ